MKAFNLVATALGGAVLIVMLLCIITGLFLSKENAALVVAPVAILVGMSARRVTEKLMGYTLYEAMKHDADGN